FDTEVIVQLHEAGKNIVEIPIPTYYGDEICYVEGPRYALDVMTDVIRYRLHKMGFGSGELAFSSDPYELKEGEVSSHRRLTDWLADRGPGRVLDLGCSDGSLAMVLRGSGHEVTAVDYEEQPGVTGRVDRFVQADLDGGIPDEVGGGYDVILAADVLEHVREPEVILADARDRLVPGGSIIVSVPNFAHWYPRLRVALGRFDYDRRGILDRGHVRFFTRRSFERLARNVGFRVRRREVTGLPIEVTDRGGRGDSTALGSLVPLIRRIDRFGLAVWPSLFAYQYLFQLEPVRD
ncbi:MAG: class I SAM-dependent methyltransferase, partial [Acidimicrobiia bacterium]